MRHLLRIVLPGAWRARLRLVRDGVRRPHLRRRYLRLPIARIALAVAVAGQRRRRGSQARGVERLSRVLVINLASRRERLSGFEREMQRLGVENFVRFDAISDASGILGCTLSHAAVMRKMIEFGWTSAMICEDDARFTVDRDALDILVDAFLDDDQAEAACLAYWHREALPHSLLYLQTTRSFTTACYLVKASIALDLAAAWEEGARMLARGGDREVYGLDHIWNPLQRTRVFLIPIIRAVRQEPGYSDIWQEYVEPAL
jgi:glycosyl transferase, family 25